MNADRAEPAVALTGVQVRLGGRGVLDIDRLTIARGELVALLGPNGAGKSTLANCLLGFAHPARGSVEVLGERVASLGAAGLRGLRRRIGYVPQRLAARSETPLTVREVVAIGRTGPAGIFRRLRESDRRLIDEWIERLGLSGLKDRCYGDLSGGEQRRCLIARAMTQQPDLLILDEPTANLDLPSRERIVATVEALVRQTLLTVVLICHELEVLPGACSRVVLLSGGRVAAAGPPGEVLTDACLSRTYGHALTVIKRGRRWAAMPASVEA